VDFSIAESILRLPRFSLALNRLRLFAGSVERY
jgi:hypothetical protein